MLSLLLQGVGGGLAATAKDSKGSRQGVDIMIAGLISQVITMSFFLGLWADFAIRTRRAKMSGSLPRMQPALYESLRTNQNFNFFQWSLFTATILIFVRCIYRVAELWNGFSGKLANHESTFMIFEGPMIIIGVAAITVFHPGRVFGDLWIPTGKGVTSTGKLAEDLDASVALTNTEWRNTA